MRRKFVFLICVILEIRGEFCWLKGQSSGVEPLTPVLKIPNTQGKIFFVTVIGMLPDQIF